MIPWYVYTIAALVGAIIGLEIYHWVNKNDGVTLIIKEKKDGKE